MTRFDRELAADGTKATIRCRTIRSGRTIHWCALLCAFADAALDHSLLPPLRLDAIRQDVEASLPGLRVCREFLTVIHASLEEQPRIVDLLHDDNLSRLRRIHRAFGDALLQERSSREIDSLDV